MKKYHNMHYIVFMSLAIVGANKAASQEQDSPRTKTKKHLLKAYSYSDHGKAPQAGQMFPNLNVPHSATSESLVSIAEPSDNVTFIMSSSPKPSPRSFAARDLRRDSSEDALEQYLDSIDELPRSPLRGTLAALRLRYPGRMGLAAEVKNVASSQEQKGRRSIDGIQVES